MEGGVFLALHWHSQAFLFLPAKSQLLWQWIHLNISSATTVLLQTSQLFPSFTEDSYSWLFLIPALILRGFNIHVATTSHMLTSPFPVPLASNSNLLLLQLSHYPHRYSHHIPIQYQQLQHFWNSTTSLTPSPQPSSPKSTYFYIPSRSLWLPIRWTHHFSIIILLLASYFSLPGLDSCLAKSQTWSNSTVSLSLPLGS